MHLTQALQMADHIELVTDEYPAMRITGRVPEEMRPDSEDVCLYTEDEKGNEYVWYYSELQEAAYQETLTLYILERIPVNEW